MMKSVQYDIDYTKKKFKKSIHSILSNAFLLPWVEFKFHITSDILVDDMMSVWSIFVFSTDC